MELSKGHGVIPVNPAPEPANFNAQVRIPGASYLASLPVGQTVRFKKSNSYWTRALPDLHRAYHGICAYTCHYIPSDTGMDTADHFQPKKAFPNLAYEWTNLRLVSNRMNARKGTFTDVVDPFAVLPGMFELDFPSLQVKPGAAMTGTNRSLADSTIKRLKLNHERNINARLEYVVRYRDSRYDFQHLAEHAPFIYSELQRQGISRAQLTVLLPP
jgi:hypothetical protein